MKQTSQYAVLDERDGTKLYLFDKYPSFYPVRHSLHMNVTVEVIDGVLSMTSEKINHEFVYDEYQNDKYSKHPILTEFVYAPDDESDFECKFFTLDEYVNSTQYTKWLKGKSFLERLFIKRWVKKASKESKAERGTPFTGWVAKKKRNKFQLSVSHFKIYKNTTVD
jgi:hypothetical protein